MNLELTEKLKEAQHGIARLHKINSMLEGLESEKEKLHRKEHELKAIMEKENYDVEKLKNKSITAVFYSIFGSLNEHLQKERKEALAAKLKYDQAVKDLEDIQYRIAELSSEQMNYMDCQNEYDCLYAQKKEELIREKGETARKLLELTDNINLAGTNVREIEEAVRKGKEVLNSLDVALGSLDSAEGWGTWDLLGGGLISDFAKHSNIDDAKAEIEHTQRLLRQFKTELVDINISSDITVEADGFCKICRFLL